MNSLLVAFLLASQLSGESAQPVQYSCGPLARRPGPFQAGKDEGGYYARTIPFVAGETNVPRLAPVAPIGDSLAGVARATVFFFGKSYSENPLPFREWRAATPLAVLREFATSAGLVVETPAPDLWIVGPPWMNERGALLVTAQPIDRTQDTLPPGQGIELGKALVAQLPVRTELSGQPEVSLIDVAYHFLPVEGRDLLLAVVTVPAMLPSRPPMVRAFKVKLNRVGDRMEIQCIWSVSDLEGPLEAKIREDFDGDGVADFVFSSESSDNPRSSVVSGRTGKELFGFSVWPLAVERKANGPKRVAVGYFKEGSVPVGEATSLYEVLTFDSKSSAFRAVPMKTEAARIGSGDESSDVNTGWQMLARLVGGAQNVVVYGGGVPNRFKNPAESRLRRSVEYRFIDSGDWRPNPTAEDIAKGYPAQILYSWESEGFRKERERQKQQIAR